MNISNILSNDNFPISINKATFNIIMQPYLDKIERELNHEFKNTPLIIRKIYSTEYKEANIKVEYEDNNAHRHIFTLSIYDISNTQSHVSVEYEWTPIFDSKYALIFKSYPEYIRKLLKEKGVDYELMKCSKILKTKTNLEKGINMFYQLIQLCIKEVKPLKWFEIHSEEEWVILKVSTYLENNVRSLLEYWFKKDRWGDFYKNILIYKMGVKASMLYLECFIPGICKQIYYIGLDTYSKDILKGNIEIGYSFDILSNHRLISKCLTVVNEKFVTEACSILRLPMSHNTVMTVTPNTIKISTPKGDNGDNAIQKYFLFLDLLIPLSKEYDFKDRLINELIKEQKKCNNHQTSLEIDELIKEIENIKSGTEIPF